MGPGKVRALGRCPSCPGPGSGLHGGQILDFQSGSGEAMGLEINHAQLGSQEGGGQLNHVQQYISK